MDMVNVISTPTLPLHMRMIKLHQVYVASSALSPQHSEHRPEPPPPLLSPTPPILSPPSELELVRVHAFPESPRCQHQEGLPFALLVAPTSPWKNANVDRGVSRAEVHRLQKQPQGENRRVSFCFATAACANKCVCTCTRIYVHARVVFPENCF